MYFLSLFPHLHLFLTGTCRAVSHSQSSPMAVLVDLNPISFVQPFQMHPINTTSQRKIFYLTPSCRQCTQMNILLLHTLSCTKIRDMWVPVVASVIEQDCWLSFHLKILISWEIWDRSLWRFGILNKVYEILDLKMCRAGNTKKIIQIIWVKKYMG